MAASALNGNTIKALTGIAIACIGLLGGAYAAHADMVGEVASLKEKVASHKETLQEFKDEIKEEIKGVRTEIRAQAEKDRKAMWALTKEVGDLAKELAVESASHGSHRRLRR